MDLSKPDFILYVDRDHEEFVFWPANPTKNTPRRAVNIDWCVPAVPRTGIGEAQVKFEDGTVLGMQISGAYPKPGPVKISWRLTRMGDLIQRVAYPVRSEDPRKQYGFLWPGDYRRTKYERTKPDWISEPEIALQFHFFDGKCPRYSVEAIDRRKIDPAKLPSEDGTFDGEVWEDFIESWSELAEAVEDEDSDEKDEELS
ncbi:MAG: hypothetical protein LUC43_04765 [Burkholderiales bacterium]|nr:hypothetical protein [Burkholderiales bacterium]